jgi:hypothetical protein
MPMTRDRHKFDRLQDLCGTVRDGEATEDVVAQIEALLAQDADSRRYFVDFMFMHALMERYSGIADSGQCETDRSATAPRQSSPVFAPLATTADAAVGHFSSGWPVAYLIAAVIFAVGLVVGAVTHVSRPVPSVVEHSPSATIDKAAGESNMEFVARITGMVDCTWSDPTTEAVNGAYVPLGRKYALATGMMEITYDTGARVILQGPVAYEVESSAGGYLSIGKLTAKLEKKSEVRGQKSESANQKSSIRNQKFCVRTPNATVTDLGTEFGVEVDRQGRTESHVFQGTVELRVPQPGGNKDRILVMHQRESFRVEPDTSVSPSVQRITPKPDAFVRRLVPPRRMPIRVFSTGVGSREGQIDPHWQLVAVSNEPDFKPRPALVSPARSSSLGWLPNEPGRSQWISIVGDGSAVPNGSTYTFRTYFDLAGLRLATAMLHVQFVADNCVRAIRLNGRELPTPEQIASPPFNAFHPLTISRGFVEGTNVLEFDVENVNEAAPEQLSADRMGLRVEFEGTAVEQNPTTDKSP